MRGYELDKSLEGVITFEAAEQAAQKIYDSLDFCSGHMEKGQMAKVITIAIWEALESIHKGEQSFSAADMQPSAKKNTAV